MPSHHLLALSSLAIAVLSASLPLNSEAATESDAAKAESDPLAAYEQSEAFTHNINWLKQVRENEIRTSWFLHGSPGIAMVCRADLSASKVTTSREVHEHASQSTKTRDLSHAQVLTLRTLSNELPPSAITPEFKNLVLVSLRENGKVKTYLYDRLDLPRDIIRLYDLTGAYLVTDRSAETPPATVRTEATAIRAREATQELSVRQPVLDVQSPDTWEAGIAEAQQQQRAIIRDLIAIARDESQAAEKRRRAILLLGRFQDEEPLSFLIKSIELRLPLEVEKGDEDMLKSTPCWYVLMSSGSWRVTQVVLSSLDVLKSNREQIYLASVLEANSGRKVAVAAVEQALSTVESRQNTHRRENLEAIKMYLRESAGSEDSAPAEALTSENAARVLLRQAKARIDGTDAPASWPEKVRRVGAAWVVDIDTTRLPSGYAEQLVVEVTSTGGHTGKPKLGAFTLYDGFKADQIALRKTVQLKVTNATTDTVQASSAEALQAAARVFGRVSFLFTNRDEVLKLLGDPATISDYNATTDDDPHKPLVYVFDSGFGGWRFTLMFCNGVCTSVEAEDLE